MTTKIFRVFALAASAGTLLQFGGCINWNRTLNSLVDHTFVTLLTPLLPDLTGLLGG